MHHPIIDVHSHYLPKPYLDAMRRTGAVTVDGFPMPEEWTVDKHLAVMQENRIASCVLSVPSPGLRFWSGEEAVRLSKAVNEAGAAIIAANPQRFGVDALLPMPDVDLSLKEIEYALDVLKLDGVGLYTNYDGVYLGDAKFRPVLEELNRRKAVVFVHAAEPPDFGHIGLGFPAPILEYPFESARMVTSLLRGGVLKDLPEVRFITTPGGGGVPFLEPMRMGVIIPMQLGIREKKAVRDSSLTPKDVTAQLATLYFDVTAVAIPSYLLALQNLAPISQVLTGFDLPFTHAQSIPPAIDALEGYAAYSEADREAVFSRNALSLYPRLALKGQITTSPDFAFVGGHRERVMPFRNQTLFYVEQWAALLLAMNCLAMTVWALLHGSAPLPDAHRTAFSSGVAFVSLHWSLSIAVAVLGVWLLRFALQTKTEESAAPETHSKNMSTPKGKAAKGSSVPKRNATTSVRG